MVALGEWDSTSLRGVAGRMGAFEGLGPSGCSMGPEKETSPGAGMEVVEGDGFDLRLNFLGKWSKGLVHHCKDFLHHFIFRNRSPKRCQLVNDELPPLEVGFDRISSLLESPESMSQALELSTRPRGIDPS
ncbi:hypothetical protein Droror1_Dr00026832 [Drosera rotundifolia]